MSDQAPVPFGWKRWGITAGASMIIASWIALSVAEGSVGWAAVACTLGMVALISGHVLAWRRENKQTRTMA